jgi:UDP-glucose 4-epimerase
LATHLVTGAAGFVGYHLVKALVARGDDVVALDNLSRGRAAYLEKVVEAGRCRLVQVDCADEKAFRAAAQCALEGRPAAAIWHLAANSDIPAGVADARIDLRDTFMTTFAALGVMAALGVPAFHFASSSAIYGDFGDTEIREDAGPCRPISNYGAMKLASEGQISAAMESLGTRATIFRFPNVVGAPATHGVIFDFVNKLRTDPHRLNVLGNGTQRKAYLHVEELVNAMLFISGRAREKVAILNIGPPDAGVTVREIAEAVRDAVSPHAEIVYGAGNHGWVGDVPRFRYATDRLAALGWKPTLTSRQAIVRAVHDILGSVG